MGRILDEPRLAYFFYAVPCYHCFVEYAEKDSRRLWAASELNPQLMSRCFFKYFESEIIL